MSVCIISPAGSRGLMHISQNLPPSPRITWPNNSKTTVVAQSSSPSLVENGGYTLEGKRHTGTPVTESLPEWKRIALFSLLFSVTRAEHPLSWVMWSMLCYFRGSLSLCTLTFLFLFASAFLKTSTFIFLPVYFLFFRLIFFGCEIPPFNADREPGALNCESLEAG